MEQSILVIKLGTAVLTGLDGTINHATIKKVVEGISALSTNYRIVLVSSGAVGSGKTHIRNYKGTLTQRKAAAAIGNPLLIQLYQKYFSTYKIPVAQALCERHHFSNRTQFLQLKETFHTFWENDVIPIVNENDLVSNVELKFSDNDELATLIAVGFSADTLILCTSVGGFVDQNQKVIPVVEKINPTIMSYVRKDKSTVGLGGMISKLTFAKLANSLGIRVIICGLKGKSPFAAALTNRNGTTFMPQKSDLKARQKWLASGSVTLGSIIVDKGAAKALHQRKSLLTVGIKNVIGDFGKDEVVQLLDEDNILIGVAKVRMPAAALLENTNQKNTVAAHADNIVVF